MGSTFPFGASAPSSSTNLSSSTNNQFVSLFGAPTTTGMGASPFTQTIPMPFGSPSSCPMFSLTGSSSSRSGTFLFGSSTDSANPFGSSSGFGLSSSTTSDLSSFSSGSGTTTGLFSYSTQSATTSYIFGSGFGSTSSAPGFSLGSSSAATTSSSPITFGLFSYSTQSATTSYIFGSGFGSTSSALGFSFGLSSAATTSSSPMTFGSTDATTSSASLSPSFPMFGTTRNPVFTFGSASTTPSVFGQPTNTPPSNFLFGSPVPSEGPPLVQFGNQHNTVAPQNPSPFQASGNVGFSAGGSFSLGSGGGGDKSKRKIVKVRRKKYSA